MQTKLEYRKHETSLTYLKQDCDELGEEGWELVGFTTDFNTPGGRTICMFKRNVETNCRQPDCLG